MIRNFQRLLSLAGAVALAGGLTSAAFGQDEMQELNTGRPRFTVLPATPGLPDAAAATLQTWNGSFSYKGKTYSYNMVGLAPTSNSTVTIKTVIIPVKIVIKKKRKTYTFDPATVLPDGKSVTTNTLDSPIFDSSTKYVQGGVTVGTTQYIDAYQRANFWGTVSTNPNYHVLLAPTVLAEQTLSPPTSSGTIGSPFGTQVGEVDINYFDTQVHSLITSLKITADTFPIFLTTNVYLTSGGCCIGGYHSAAGQQSYAHATYITTPGSFAQDVSALSHEVGEWMDDPLVASPNGNQTTCGILENGDPLEGGPNYGGYPYVLNGFTYNLQDLVTLPYFGAPPTTSVNSFFTFQGEKLTVCQNGS